MGHDIFISYSRKDSAFVQSVVDRLKESGYSCWMDVTGIESGDAFKRVLVQAIKNSKLVLYFSSVDSNSSEWTVKEINIAVQLKKPVIPVRLDSTPYDDSILFDLSGLDYVVLGSGPLRDDACEKLLRSISAKILNPSVSGTDSRNLRENASCNPAKRRGCSVSICISICLLVAFSFFGWFNMTDGKTFGVAGRTDTGNSDSSQMQAQSEIAAMGGTQRSSSVQNYFAGNETDGTVWQHAPCDETSRECSYTEGAANDGGVSEWESDEGKVREWRRKLAEQGDAQAQCSLAGMYQYGRGGAKDLAEAVRWYRKAAEQGLVEAQYLLGLMYQRGQGVERNEAEAARWFRKAAEQRGTPDQGGDKRTTNVRDDGKKNR